MEYKILDNFLENTFIDYLSSLELKKIRADEVISYHNKIDKNGNVKSTCIDPEILKKIQNSCHNIAIEILNTTNIFELVADGVIWSVTSVAVKEFVVTDVTPEVKLTLCTCKSLPPAACAALAMVVLPVNFKI